MTPRTAFIAPDQVSVHQAAGWIIVPGEKRKAAPGIWHVLMRAPSRVPLWWRLRRRLGLGGHVSPVSGADCGAGDCSAFHVHGSRNKPVQGSDAPVPVSPPASAAGGAA